jgi:prepilin-type N-terminal cleavage/methylation domain-containing protein
MKSASIRCLHDESGLTLIETLIALVVMSILVPSVLIWNRHFAHLASMQFARTETDVQAWQGFYFMRSEIHDGKLFTVSSNGKELNFYSGTGDQITYRCNASNQILRQVNGVGASVIANDVVSLSFTVDSSRKGVTILMQTSVGGVTLTWHGFVAGRGGY